MDRRDVADPLRSPGPPEPGGPLRRGYNAELDQLRLQVELLAVRVDQNLERMRTVLSSGDAVMAAAALAADDDIDAMSVSLTARCYDVLAREQPVASDLRFVVSVLRVLGEFERVGDLALRVVKLAPSHHLLTAHRASFDVLVALADEATDHYRLALRAWSGQDAELAVEVARHRPAMTLLYQRLVGELLRLDGPGGVAVAIPTVMAGRSLDRISDHAALIGTRLLYLVTGDAGHLADEVR